MISPDRHGRYHLSAQSSQLYGGQLSGLQVDKVLGRREDTLSMKEWDEKLKDREEDASLPPLICSTEECQMDSPGLT